MTNTPDEYGEGSIADEKVNAWLLDQFKSDYLGSHFRECEGPFEVLHTEAENGSYGCETGCEYARLRATFVCPHVRVEWEYGDFGDIASMLHGIAEFDLTPWEGEY